MIKEPTIKEVIEVVKAYRPSSNDDARRYVKFLRTVADVISNVTGVKENEETLDT